MQLPQWIFFFFSIMTKLVYAKKLTYFSNNKPGFAALGPESGLTDFVAIAQDPVSNLPDEFTICTSLFFGTLTTHQNVIQVYKDDGTHWFHLHFSSSKDLSGNTETLFLYYDTSKLQKSNLCYSMGQLSGKEQKNTYMFRTAVPVVPHSWYHICLGIDTLSGLLRIVVNGHIIVTEAKDFFKGTSFLKPKSVKGKFLG